MSGLNRVQLIGHLGADPELKFTQGGQAVLKLRLATTEVCATGCVLRAEWCPCQGLTSNCTLCGG